MRPSPPVLPQTPSLGRTRPWNLRARARRAAFAWALGAAALPGAGARPQGGPVGNSAINSAVSDMQQMQVRQPADSPVAQPVAQPSQEQLILNLMRPERVTDAELAPDGGHLAYVAYDQYRVQLMVIDLDHPESPASLEIGQGDWWKRMTGGKWTPPSVTFLRWATGRRLVFAEGDNGIYAVNADAKGLTTLATPADLAVLKGQDLSVLAETPPPGMGLTPNQLDQMAGSPPTTMDPMTRVQGQSDGGPVNSLPASSGDLAMADPRSNSYINNGTGPDRATDPAAVLEGNVDRMSLPGDKVPRTPRVVAMPPEDPEHIIIEGSGLKNSLSGLYSYGLYRVDVETGARVSIGEAELPGHQVWYDRAGHLRIVLGAIGRTYLHVFPGRAVWRGSKPLDKLVRNAADRGFQSKPETFFGAHAVPIEFDYDPNILYYASNLGRDTMGVYALDLKSGTRTAFALESPNFDVVDPTLAADPAGFAEGLDPLVFDPRLRKLVGVRLAGPTPSTRWLDAGLAQIQARLERQFPERTVEILQWDAQRTRYLALVSGPTDPGRYYVYTPASEDLILCARRSPWIASANVCATAAFDFAAPDGTPLTGTVTPAHNARIHPPPLVVLCPDGPGLRPPADFDRDAQAYAGMGFTVLRVNYRGTGGLGLRHLGAIRAGIDQVPLADILAAIDAAGARTPIDPKRIAVVGEGLGGYLALRAVQLHPERFRCAVAICAPVDLGQWVHEPDLIANAQSREDTRAAFQTIVAEEDAGNPLLTLDALHADVNVAPPAPPAEDPPELFLAKARLAFFGGDRRAFAAISPDRDPQDLIRPLFLIQDGAGVAAYVSSAEALRAAVEKRGGQVDFLTIQGRPEEQDASGRAKVLAQIEAFLNLDFYSYNVEIGNLKTRD